MKRTMTRAVLAFVISAITLPYGALAQDASGAAPTLGSPPSGDVPVLFNNRHVFAKPDKLEHARVLAALVKGGTILVPLRSLFEQTGAIVRYIAATKTVHVFKPGADIRVTVGERIVIFNGETRPLDVAPEIDKGVLLVPLRVISEAMGAYVQWLPERRIVSVRYSPMTSGPPPTEMPTPAPTETAAPAAPSPSPSATATPEPSPTPYHFEAFAAGDYAFSPKVYNELAPGQNGRNSFEIKGGFEFPLLGPTWMLEGDLRHVEYLHPSDGTALRCTAGNVGCNTVVGSDPTYQVGLCPSSDAGCVTVPGFAQIAAFNGLGQAYVPSFYAKENDVDAKFALKVADPRVYLGIGGFFKKYDYLGYPSLSGVGGGIEKLPDLANSFSVYGSAWYYPSVTGRYTYPTSTYLGALSGTAIDLKYSVFKYEVGATLGLGRSPLYVDFGYGGERFRASENAPADTQIASPFVGLGLRL